MHQRLGPSHWWPADSPFEVAVGAILTQNTNWKNVSKAIFNLKSRDLLHPDKIYRMSEADLAELIRPSGYFRIKANRLHNFVFFLRDECGFEISELAFKDRGYVRERLLSVKGIGPETADSIMLYALDMPVFVVDAYTRRIANRHHLVPEDVEYAELQELFSDVLDPDPVLFNEYHALLVRTAVNWCLKKTPRCENCPLHIFLP